MEPQSKHITHKSIAVLPFVNMSADPDNEYFSDGITEEIINALTTIQGLKVIARTSSFAFKGKNMDVRTIGSQLGVSTVLEGSVRKAKNRVRITAQLISTDDGSHFWAKNFDSELEDIFALQDEVSLLIADQIRENFGHLEIPSFHHSIPTRNMNAFDLVLKGNYYLKRKDFDDIKRALQLFQEAIQIDETYADAYASLGETYLHVAGFGMMSTKEAHELARKASEKAVELNEENAQGHKVLAYIQLFFDWNWDAALQAYDKAIKYGLPDQNEFITYYYIFIKEDFGRAIQVAKKGIETDPLHVISHWQLGLTYYFARRFEEAIAAFSAALEVDPNFGEVLRFRGLVKGYLGKYKEALIDINRALELTSGQGLAKLDMLVVKILMGHKEEVLTVMQNSEYVDSSDPAFLYSLLDMPDEAMYWLEKAYQERSVMMVTLKNFWVWDNLRDDSRFQEIYERMNFPSSIENRRIFEPINIIQETANVSLLNDEEIVNYLQQLEQLINEEKIFTDPSLSLRQLAEKMGLHPNKLSWLLNEHINKNFNEYINAFRLETFKVKALNPQNSHLTLLGLAYESGFNSKTVFNAFLKKLKGDAECMGEKETTIVSQQQVKTTPLTSYQILLIVVFVFILFTIVVDYMTLPALSAILLPELQITTKEFGLVVSAYAFSAGISAFLATSFADSFDRKKLLLVYYGGFLLGMILCATAHSFMALIIARVVTGAFGGVVAAICFAIVADLFQSDQRGRVMGYVQMAFAASLIAGLPLALYLATNFHWHLTYWIFFIFGIFILLILFFKINPINAHLNNPQKDNLLKHSVSIVRSRDYWAVFFNNIFIVLGDTMFMTFSSAYSTNNLGISLDDLPLLYGAGGLATIVFSPVIGQLSDRYGKLKIFIVGTVLAITLVAIYSNLGSVPFWLVLVLHTLLFIGINARMIASTALATIVPGQTDRGAFMALDSSFQQVAGGIAATAAGWIVYQASDGMIHGYPSLGWAVIGIMFVTIGLMYAINLIIKKKTEPAFSTVHFLDTLDISPLRSRLRRLHRFHGSKRLVMVFICGICVICGKFTHNRVRIYILERLTC